VLENEGHQSLLDSHRCEVAVVFSDLRGFTTFSAWPNQMTRWASLPNITKLWRDHRSLRSDFDLLHGRRANASAQRAAPALLAARMAVDMQNAVQKQEL
jgi:hypothetical protein